MNPRTTGILLLGALGLFAFVYFYEMQGEGARLEAEQATKRLFSGIEAADVTWIALRTSDGVDARFEQREGRWELTQPIAFPADAAVERIAEALATVTSETTFEHPQPDAEYGLDDAAAGIVRFGAGDAEHALRIGKATPVGSNVYARTDESPAVHTIASYRATALERTLTDLRDKQILDFDTSAIRELEVRWPGARVVLARTAQPPRETAAEGGDEKAEGAAPDILGDWQMTAPIASRADSDAVDNLLSTLSYLRADGFVDAPTDAQRERLDPPDFEVLLRGGDVQAAPRALAISRPDGAEKRLVRAGRDVLFEIAAARLTDFPRETAAYRDRHLARFLATDAQQVDFFFHAPDGDPVAIRAERSADAGWSSTPESFGSGKLADVVSELSRLEAADIVAESMGETDLEKLGLSPPSTILTVLGAAPAPAKDAAPDALPPAAPRLSEVHFGNVTPEGVVARAVGDPIVYRVDLETAERLPVSLEAFRNRFQEKPTAAEETAPDAEADSELRVPAEESP